MTSFKTGDLVRVVKHPSDGWWNTGKMPVGREFSLHDTFSHSKREYARDDEGYCIPLDCIERVVTALDGWQPWNPPSEDRWPKARSGAADKRRLDAKFGPRPVDEWDV